MTILSWLAKRILWLLGWHLDGDIPPIKKAIIVGAYHTSNWDGVLLIIAGIAHRRRIRWIGKHTLFQGLAGPFVRLVGGIAINRTVSSGVVEEAVKTFNQSDELLLTVAPEGTRRRVSRWKRGFYYIAVGAGVPLILAAPDYPTRRIIIGPVIYPTGDIEADVEKIRSFYETTTPKFPEQAGPIVVAATTHHDTPTPE